MAVWHNRTILMQRRMQELQNTHTSQILSCLVDHLQYVTLYILQWRFYTRPRNPGVFKKKKVLLSRFENWTRLNRPSLVSHRGTENSVIGCCAKCLKLTWSLSSNLSVVFVWLIQEIVQQTQISLDWLKKIQRKPVYSKLTSYRRHKNKKIKSGVLWFIRLGVKKKKRNICRNLMRIFFLVWPVTVFTDNPDLKKNNW